MPHSLRFLALVILAFTLFWTPLDWGQEPPTTNRPGSKQNEKLALPPIFAPDPKGDFELPPQDQPSLSPEEIASIPEPPSPQITSEYEKACIRFDNGSFVRASDGLKAFLREHPKSSHAPEAAFKLGAALLLCGKNEEATAAYRKLIGDYFDSTWAKLALVSHFNDKDFLALVDQKYQPARKAKNIHELGKAFQAYQLFLARFPNSQEKGEAVYKAAICAYIAGDMDSYREGMKVLEACDKDGTWGALGRFRMGDAEFFRKGMDELVELDAGLDSEAVFLELAEKYSGSFTSKEKIKCRFYQARCCGDVKIERRLYQEIIHQHPKSSWAPEALFWLAELDYSKKRWSRAKARYLELAHTYPGSPRAAQAAKWAACIDTAGKSARELQKIGDQLVQRLSGWNDGLSFCLRKDVANEGPAWEAQLAYQNGEGLLKARLGQSIFVVAQNKKGLWCQYESGCIYKVKSEVIPSHCTPSVRCTMDPKTETVSCTWGIGRGEPGIDIAPGVVAYTVGLIQKSTHVWTEKRGNGLAVVFQYPRWNAQETLTLELEVGPDGAPHGARCAWPEENGSTSWITLTDIKLGERLTEQAFEISIPAGTAVREVEQINQFEAFGHAMNMLGAITGPIQSRLKKK
jgi:TolA-binding protein